MRRVNTTVKAAQVREDDILIGFGTVGDITHGALDGTVRFNDANGTASTTRANNENVIVSRWTPWSIYTDEYLIELLDAALQEITMEYTHGYNKLPRDRVKREMLENACALTSIVRDRRAKLRETTAEIAAGEGR